MRGLDLNTVMFVHTCIYVDHQQLQDAPVELSDIEGMSEELRVTLEAGAKKRMQYYDMYNNIASVSTLIGKTYTHHVVPRDSSKWETGVPYSLCEPGVHGSKALIAYDAEATLLARFWETTLEKFGTTHLAGWQFVERALPVLTCKGLAANVTVPDKYKTDITRKYGASEFVFDVDAIYAQSAKYSKLRPVPPLTEVLQWWNVPQTTNITIPPADDINKLTTPAEWELFVGAPVEQCLGGMQYLVGKYYGYTDGLGNLQGLW